MKIKINKDITLSYDGLNTRLYEKGKEYEAGHAQEHRAFQNAVATGSAQYVVEATPTKETKIFTPKGKK